MTTEFALNVAKPIKIDLYMTDYLPKTGNLQFIMNAFFKLPNCLKKNDGYE